MTAKTGNKKPVSVRELASRLGVSTATVSRAINNHASVAPETRARVLELADRTGYMPRVGNRYNRVVGLVYPSDPVQPDYGSFESALLAGILRGLKHFRYDLSLIDIERDIGESETYTQFFRRKGVRGVIVRPIRPQPTLAERISSEGFPCVMVADRSESGGVNFVCCDSGRESEQAVDHLLLLGHTRIALVVHSVMDSDHRDRKAGYLRALEGHGVPVSSELVLEMPASMTGGAQAIDRLMALPEPPTAIYFTNPLPTLGALHRCLELKVHVPDDLSIIGFDDSDVRLRTFPRYTAVCQDAEAFGHEAASWLTRTLEGVEHAPLKVHRPAALAFHQSTGPVPASPVRLAPNRSEVFRLGGPAAVQT